MPCTSVLIWSGEGDRESGILTSSMNPLSKAGRQGSDCPESSRGGGNDRVLPCSLTLFCPSSLVQDAERGAESCKAAEASEGPDLMNLRAASREDPRCLLVRISGLGEKVWTTQPEADGSNAQKQEDITVAV